MRVLVTGTPGVGKTTLSQEISQRTGWKHVEITKFVKENKLYEEFDTKLSTLVFDENIVANHLNDFTCSFKSFIIDTHSPVVAAGIDFDFIFHIICDTGEIGKRLAARGYSAYKIEKNIECEIFNLIEEELEESFSCEIYKINGSPISHTDTRLTFEDVFKILRLD